MKKIKNYTLPTRLIRNKKQPWGGYATRKSWNNDKCFYTLPRGGDYYFQVDSARSRRKKQLKKYGNRKIRKSTKVAYQNGEYKKVFDLPRILD